MQDTPKLVLCPFRSSLAGAALLALFAAAGTAVAQDVTAPGDQVDGSSFNYPGGENPNNVIDNTARTKYLNFDKLNTGFTVTPLGSGVVRAISIITANDAPERDPTSFILEGSNDGNTFALIAQGDLFPDVTRFAYTSARFVNNATYTTYRVTFPTVRNADAANSMQVAEVQLLTSTNITTPGDPISVVYPDGAFSGGGEGAANLFDSRIGTKMGIFNGDVGPTFVTITPSVGASVISGIDFYAGNDDSQYGGRTPAYITISGSNDGGATFTQLFTTPLVLATQDFFDQQYSFTNTTSYTSYLIEIGPAQAANFTQIGEIQLYGTANSAAPANDTCATARPILAGTIVGNNLNATGTDSSGCGTNDTADVWYSYVATSTGTVEVNTFGDGGLDTTLVVYDGCGGPVLGCNDNARKTKSRVQFSATAGHTYQIRVAGHNRTQGVFTLNIVPNPVAHNNVFVPLNVNFNGMVQAGEGGDPDSPLGYRSISDRGFRLVGTASSFEVGLESNSGIPYSLITTPNVLDIVQLGNRDTVDGGRSPYDFAAGNAESDDGNGGFYNRIGVRPDWATTVDNSGPQTTDLSALNLTMTADTKIGWLFHSSNGGTSFLTTFTFTDGTTSVVSVTAPDWYSDQSPPAADVGVASQTQLGVFSAVQNYDLADVGVDLNVVEAIVTTASLGAIGPDVTGKTLQSITFSDATSLNAGTAIYAVTIRDGGAGAPACPADFNNDGVLNSDDLSDFITGYFDVPADPRTDFNGDTVINADDLGDFITAYFNGC